MLLKFREPKARGVFLLCSFCIRDFESVVVLLVQRGAHLIAISDVMPQSDFDRMLGRLYQM